MVQRAVDELGRIVLPAEMRNVLGVNTKTIMNVILADGEIVLQKADPCCKLCGSSVNVIQTDRGCVCAECVDTIKRL